MDSGAGKSAHGFDRPDHPLHEVDLVNALIHDRPAAVELPGTAPGAGSVIFIGAMPRRDDTDPCKPAETVLLNGFTQGGIGGVPAVLKDSGEPDAVFF